MRKQLKSNQEKEMEKESYFNKPIESIMEGFEVDPKKGLSSDQVSHRQS